MRAVVGYWTIGEKPQPSEVSDIEFVGAAQRQPCAVTADNHGGFCRDMADGLPPRSRWTSSQQYRSCSREPG